MTKEQYERAELIARKLRNLNYALDAMKSREDVTLNINWFRHEEDVLPTKVVLCDVGLNNTIKDFIANRIAELEKEFEGI